MKQDNIKEQAYAEALIEFRNKHMKEMERNIQVAISIRDDLSATHKSRNDAIRIIAQMLAGLQSESRVASAGHAKAESLKQRSLSQAEMNEIERRLNE